MSRPTSARVVPVLLFIALVVAVVGSLGTPLITQVASSYHVSLAAAQWTLTIPLLSGAVATPILGRLGSGPHRRGTVVATLGVVTFGSLCTVLPLPFAWLLVGRAAQGAGLGLTPLMMAAARDHLESTRATSAIAMISIASTAGIGVGYPIAGLLTDAGGVRAAYAMGLVAVVAAFCAAWVGMPHSPPGRSEPLDVIGALVLGPALLLMLLAIGQESWWRDNQELAIGVLIASFALLAGWVTYERGRANPLVDLSLLRHSTVIGANLAMLLGGVGMYLLLTSISRFVQTPESTGYGFGVSTFVAGLVLVPFSAMGFVAGRLTPAIQRRLTPIPALAVSSIVVLIAFVLFAVVREPLAAPVAAMTILGFGVGSFAASMPTVILAVTPLGETASAMGVNQVVRSVGFSIGSALGGLILSRHTAAGSRFPSEHGYAVAAWIGVATMAVTTAVILSLRRRSPAT